MIRNIYRDIPVLALNRGKMALICGPRQVGKTTLAKSLKGDVAQFVYKNRDETTFSKMWVKSPNQVENDFALEVIHGQKLSILRGCTTMIQKFLRHTKCPYVQVVQKNEIWRAAEKTVVASAERFFSGLP
jgi:GTPase SAR1 family protein